MKLPFLKKKPEIFLALDIGTEAVKTLIFKKEDDQKIVLEKGLEYFKDPETFKDFDFPEEILKKAINGAIDQISKIAKPKNILLGLPANILSAKIVNQNFERENPKEPISQSEKEKIEEEVFHFVKDKIIQDSGFFAQDLHFSKFKILKAKIDGYEVPSIFNLTGKNLEFLVLAVFFKKYQFEKIERICQSFNFKILKISHPIENLDLLFPDEKINAIFLDIGGKITNIFLIEKGKIIEISQFNLGGFDFTQKIYQSLGFSFPQARFLKENYCQSTLSENVKKRVKEIIFDVLENWFENLKENLKKFSPKLLPANFFLFGGGSLLPDIPEILENGNWNDLNFISKPKAEIIFPKKIKNIKDENQILNNPQDIPLILIL